MGGESLVVYVDGEYVDHGFLGGDEVFLTSTAGAIMPLVDGSAIGDGKPGPVNQRIHSPLPRVPVSLWIAGTVPAAAERAGRLGDGWLTGQNATRDQLIEQLDVYRESAARAGRPPVPVLRRDIYVGESDQEAEAVVGPILAEGYRGTGRDPLLVGGPATVVQQLREYRALGFDHVLVRHIVGDHRTMLQSFARIGAHVIPAIRHL